MGIHICWPLTSNVALFDISIENFSMKLSVVNQQSRIYKINLYYLRSLSANDLVDLLVV